MQYWFLMMVVENSWASKCLEAELKNKRVCFEYMCTSWKHSALQTQSLLMQRAEHPPSPVVVFWEQSTPEGRLCGWQKPLWPVGMSKGPLVFSNCLPGTLCPVKTGGEFTCFGREKKNQTHCQPFSAQIHAIAFRQQNFWVLFGPSSEYCLSLHVQLSAPCYFQLRN